MSNATKGGDWIDAHHMGICHDCHESPPNAHFTTVPSLQMEGYAKRFGLYSRELFNDAVCDKCFLRRRFEGQL